MTPLSSLVAEGEATSSPKNCPEKYRFATKIDNSPKAALSNLVQGTKCCKVRKHTGGTNKEEQEKHT
jgi:hypothetical protein